MIRRWPMLLLIPAVSFAQVPPEPAKSISYKTEADISAERKSADEEREAMYYDYPVGKSFWYVPGPGMQVGFYKFTRRVTASYTTLDDKFFPNTQVRFDVLELILLNAPAYGAREYIYRVKIEDGTMAFMNAGDFGSFRSYARGGPEANREEKLSKKASDLSPLSQYNYKLFTEDPDAIRAAYQADRERLAIETARAAEAAEAASRKAEAEVKATRLAEERAYKKEGGVRIGMNKRQVLASNWGRPDSVNRTTGSYGVHEQWVYDGSYLYFENGVLRTIQN